MSTRWECRYSSSEMLYLELRGDHVITYLHHSPNNPDRFPFADILAGTEDAMISQLFGAAAVDQVKAAIHAQSNAPPPLTKEQLRQQRRLEQQRDREDRQREGWPGRKPDQTNP
jgi:hypothetical protein